jgi:hypothetical protein
MKRQITINLILLLLGVIIASPALALVSVSYMGYHPSGVKTVIVYGSAPLPVSFTVIGPAGTVKSGTLAQATCQGGVQCAVGDFSDVTATGTYHIVTSDGQSSASFAIDPGIYANNAPLFAEFFDATSMRGSSYHADMNKAMDPQLLAMADGSYIMTSWQASSTLIRLADAFRRDPALLQQMPKMRTTITNYVNYLEGIQDANVQQRSDGVGFRLGESTQPNYAFVPGPTSLTSLQIYDPRGNPTQRVPVISLCGNLTGSAYTSCIADAATYDKCQADEACLDVSYNGPTATRSGQKTSLGMPNAWQYEWGCFFDVDLQNGNYNDPASPNPCMFYDTAESRANTAATLLAYAEAAPVIYQYDPAKAMEVEQRAELTQQYIKAHYAQFAAGDDDAGSFGAASFILYDLTLKPQYLQDAYNVRALVSQQLVSDMTHGSEFYWQEYVSHKDVITAAGLIYPVQGFTGGDPAEAFRGKMYYDYYNRGTPSMSANAEHVFIFDNDVNHPAAYQNSRFMLTEGVLALKTIDLSADQSPFLGDIADSQVAWLTGRNQVRTAAGRQSLSFIFGIGSPGQFPSQFHSRLLMRSGYAQQSGGTVPGMREIGLMFRNETGGLTFLDGRTHLLSQTFGAEGNQYHGEAKAPQLDPGMTFLNGKSYISGWINGVLLPAGGGQYTYLDDRQLYEYTETTSETVATAVELFAYLDAHHNKVAPLKTPAFADPPAGGSSTFLLPYLHCRSCSRHHRA